MPDCPDYLNILFDIIGHSQKQAKSSVVLENGGIMNNSTLLQSAAHDKDREL